jgi:hypothetical protein
MLLHSTTATPESPVGSYENFTPVDRPNGNGHTPPPRSAPTADDIVLWLRPTVEPGSVIELRALNCVDDPKYPAFTTAGFFDSDHLLELARAALKITGKAEGVYVTMNPVNPDLLARKANRVAKVEKKDFLTKDPDIVRRTQLTFDCDPTRPAGISATDAEKALGSQQKLIYQKVAVSG